MNRRIHGCRVARGAPPVMHFMFVDDCLVFFKASMVEETKSGSA